MSTFSRTATLFSTVALGSMLTATTVSSVDTVIHAAETTQTAAQKQSYKLQILQGDKDTPSTASQFYLDTISLEKLANGDYYAYLTSNTPANLGDEPIASTDTQHQVVKMGTKQNNGYNQTVYRMTLSANELASGQPIKTNIHVNIPMMNYDHNYTIRLNIQGFKPEPVASSQSTSSASTTNSSAVAPSSSVANSATTESNVANGVSQSTKNNPSSTTDTSKSTVAKTDSSQNDSQQATSDTAASTVNNSQTTKSTVDAKADDQIPAGKEVKMTADQGMDRFLKPSAYINIKGDLTDVTLSLNSDKVISMIPYMIFDGQKKDVTSQNITFTIPTKDLVADKDGNVTLASTTHVDAAGHVMDYPSNLTFNISQLMPAQKTFKTGDYQIAVSPDSQMDRFFAPKFNVKVGDVTSTVTVTYQNPNMMAMIPNVTFDGQTKDLNGKTTVDFTIPTKDLTPNKDGKVTIASFTSVPMSPHKGYASNITLDMNPALTNPSNDQTDSSASSSSETPVKPDKDILQDGTYSINYNVYKSGTTDASTMATYMTESAKVTVKKGEATVDFATKNDAMSMMKEFSINGVKAQAKGDSWIVKLPVKDLTKTANAQMTIFVAAINFTETPSADIVFDMKSVKTLDNDGGASSSSSAASSSKPSSSSSSAASSSKPTTPANPTIEKDGNYSINYKIYKSGTTDASTMATYMTESAKVTVKKGEATVDFATKNDAMSMMKEFSINGVKAQAKGDSWIVKLPVKDLTKTANAQMTIFVAAINFTETPSADIVFDMKSLKALDNDGGASSSSSATSSSKPSQSSSSAASSSKPSSSSSSASSSSKPENKPEQKLTTDFKDGTYNVNYHIYKSGTTNNSTMSQYMTTSAKVVIKDGKATISFATKNKAMSMMKRFSVNGVNAKAKGDKWIVTVPSKNLEKTLTAHMHIEVPQIGLTEDPDADIKFEIAKGSHSASSSSSSSAGSSSAGSSSASSAINTGTKPINDNKKLSLKNNGIYSINYRVYKTGTHAKSTMQQYMTASANILVKDGKATIKFATKNGAMSLMKAFSINGVTAHKNGNAWQVTLPVSSLRQTIKAHMTIFVPSINFTEHPDADIVFDLSSLKNSNAKTTDFTKTKTDNTTPSGVNGAVALPTGHQNAIRNAVLHQLTILHGNNNSTSVAAQYFLPTIQLVHNANGSYTGYITTHTPVMMGRNPISFMDGNHQVQLVNTIKTGSYYQSTYRLSLSENEIKAPIATSIHVKFTAPLNYDHIYTIRLVIGRILNDASEATQPTTGLPDSSNLTTSPLSSDVSHGTFTTDFNSNAITGTSFTPLNTTNDDSQNNEKKANTIKPHTKKNSNATQVNKDAQADSKSNNTTQRNVLIVAGGILAAALGYIGVALLTNFFKMR
jgi:heme-binding NEAT domain protein